MPSFVAPQECDLRLEGPTPVIALRGVEVSVTSGWQLLCRETLIVVDGPGDEGFLIRRLAPDGSQATPPGWDDALAERGGAEVELDNGDRLFAANASVAGASDGA